MRLKEVDYMRFYATISLVVWHCFVCPLTVWSDVSIEPNVATSLVRSIAKYLIPIANMPLFTFIAGYVFIHIMQTTDKYDQFKKFAWIKCKRLVIPFLTTGTLVCLTAPQRYLWMIPYGAGSHLWYCIMLFWICLVAWAVVKLDKWILTYVLFIGSMALVLLTNCSASELPQLPLGIRNSAFFYCYFYMGMLLYQYRNNRTIIWSVLGTVILFFILSAKTILGTAIPAVQLFHSFLYSPLLFMVLYVIAMMLGEYVKEWTFVQLVCNYSFGIYVFHEWISWCTYHYEPAYHLYIQAPFLFASVFTVVVFGLSLLLTHYSLKTNIGKVLLGAI